MKSWKCPECYRERETEENIMVRFCLCGSEMELVRNNSDKLKEGCDDGERK